MTVIFSLLITCALVMVSVVANASAASTGSALPVVTSTASSKTRYRQGALDKTAIIKRIDIASGNSGGLVAVSGANSSPNQLSSALKMLGLFTLWYGFNAGCKKEIAHNFHT